jgi:hypothetical protein
VWRWDHWEWFVLLRRGLGGEFDSPMKPAVAGGKRAHEGEA